MNCFRKFWMICLLALTITPLCAQDSLNVSRIGRWDYWDQAMHVAMFSHYAYVATNYTGVRIMDIQDTGRPVEVGSIPNFVSGGGIMDLAVWQDYLILAAGYSGLRVLSLTDPVHPLEVDRCDTLGYIPYVDVSGLYVFALEPGAGTHIFFINPLQQLVWQGCLESPCQYPTHVVTYDDYACISDICGNVEIFNISNPAYAQHAGTWEMGGVSWDIAVSGYYLYAAMINIGLAIADISNPASPQTVSRSDPFDATAIHISGTSALVGKYNQGLSVYDVSNPQQPNEVVTYFLPGIVSDIACAVQLAVTANGDWGLRIVDVFGIAGGGEIGRYDTPHNPDNKIYAEGNRAYVPDGNAGTWIVNVTDPAQPVPLVFDAALTNIRDMDFFDEYAVTIDRSGLRILYVGIPTLITTIGSYPLTDARSLAFLEPYCYVACENQGVYAFNMMNPLQPQNIGFCSAPIHVRKLRGEGNTLCLMGDDTLIVIDVSNPYQPAAAGGLSAVNCSQDLYVWNHQACLAGFSPNRPGDPQYGNVVTVNIANPAQPFAEDTLVYSGTIWSMAGQDDFVYVMGSDIGLRVINISSPQQLRETGYFHGDPNLYMISANGRYVYGSGYTGFQVFDCSRALPAAEIPLAQPSTYSLASCYPNPFNAVTTIGFEVKQHEIVSLKVYNIAGQLVQTLVNERMTPGAHTLAFDGLNLASGIYICRMEAEDFSATTKMVMLK